MFRLDDREGDRGADLPEQPGRFLEQLTGVFGRVAGGGQELRLEPRGMRSDGRRDQPAGEVLRESEQFATRIDVSRFEGALHAVDPGDARSRVADAECRDVGGASPSQLDTVLWPSFEQANRGVDGAVTGSTLDV